MQIAQLTAHADKTNIPSITVTVLKAYESKPTAKGFQCSYKVTDGTGETYMKFFTQHQMTPLAENSQVTVASVPGKNGALTGVSVNIWNGKASINCSDLATINGAAQGAQMPAQQPQQAAPQPAYQAPQQPQAAPQQPAQAQPAYQAPAQAAPQVAGGGVALDKIVAIASKAAEGTAVLVQELQAKGFSREEAIALASGSAGMIPVYWGGDKFV